MLRIDLFTDPACPFAFSHEPVRWRLRWLYGDAVAWRPRMIGLADSIGEMEARGLTPARNRRLLDRPWRRRVASIRPGERLR